MMSIPKFALIKVVRVTNYDTEGNPTDHADVCVESGAEPVPAGVEAVAKVTAEGWRASEEMKALRLSYKNMVVEIPIMSGIRCLPKI